MEIAKPGDQVQIHYTGRLEDGTIFDSSHGRAPLKFSAGGSEVILGVSEAVLGMRPGQSKTVTVEPESGYGERLPELEQRVSRNMVPEGAQVGDPLHAEVKGETLVVWITELGEDFAVLDLNHPLAGHTLTFDIELVALESK
ncbi:MAG: peptidylprolyl isomerase [Deltaproteobacteria bacterium]|nr:peptidylprolyl isomerase [Deltaproteobacteria bacterium]MBW2121571.1 peptidylprolyl isomerase [Deltaproteobacteria bacterium]